MRHRLHLRFLPDDLHSRKKDKNGRCGGRGPPRPVQSVPASLLFGMRGLRPKLSGSGHIINCTFFIELHDLRFQRATTEFPRMPFRKSYRHVSAVVQGHQSHLCDGNLMLLTTSQSVCRRTASRPVGRRKNSWRHVKAQTPPPCGHSRLSLATQRQIMHRLLWLARSPGSYLLASRSRRLRPTSKETGWQRQQAVTISNLRSPLSPNRAS